MDWISRLNDTITYIEKHLTEEIDYAVLGQMACCSSFHYQRMFTYMAGVPLSEYIRRRRMTKAVTDLQGGAKIIDVAYKYGYSSPTSFNRAFQSVHGVAPSMAKENGVILKSFLPLSFKITIKGVEEMEFRIEQKENIRIVGMSMPLHKEIEKNFAEVPQMWGKAQADGTIEKLITMMDCDPKGVLGVSVCNSKEEWKYLIAVASNLPINSSDFEEYTIPSATWAIFAGEGAGVSIQELQKRIFTEWLPTSGYEYGDAADIEVYIDPNPQHTKYEVWLPVVKKDV